jgi:hypothetical protein
MVLGGELDMPDEQIPLLSAFEVLPPRDTSPLSSKLHAYFIESTAPGNIDDNIKKRNDYSHKYMGVHAQNDVVKTIAN